MPARPPGESCNGGDAVTPSDLEKRERVLQALKWTTGGLADEVHELGLGWCALTPSMPRVHSLNQLRVTTPVTVGEVLGATEEWLGDLPYRHVGVEDETVAALLESSLAGAGWRVERLVLMAMAHEPASGSGPEADTAPPAGSGDGTSAGARGLVVELGEDEMVELMCTWLLEEGRGVDEIDDLVEMNRREGKLWGEQRLGVRESGRAVAVTKYRSDGTTAWVEDVYTVPEARRRGFARTLVSTAVARARAGRHELTFIVADDEDWPKHLYADVGFGPVGYLWNFHCDLDR
jgi:GNAT superfamily N-acetyltransferase